MAWKKGPLPKGTYNWGGIVRKQDAGSRGFEFADFNGDHVVLVDGTKVDGLDVLLYDNSLELPPDNF